MGYRKIPNLYADQTILLMAECWATEKVHGTSTHIKFDPNTHSLRFFSGGLKQDVFEGIFPDKEDLLRRFESLVPRQGLIVYGEGYGGKCQAMSATYGKEASFVAFEVKVIGPHEDHGWLPVPEAHWIVDALGLEFVPYERVRTDLSILDAFRDAPSIVAVRRGIVEPRPREGIVLRPIEECRNSKGNRIITKHVAPAFRETHSIRHVEVDPTKRDRLKGAQQVAEEWVTDMRLVHVADKVLTGGKVADITQTGDFVRAMMNDIGTEAGDEIEWTPEIRRAVGTRAALLWKRKIAQVLSPDGR